jgi:hypothetical protein
MLGGGEFEEVGQKLKEARDAVSSLLDGLRAAKDDLRSARTRLREADRKKKKGLTQEVVRLEARVEDVLGQYKSAKKRVEALQVRYDELRDQRRAPERERRAARERREDAAFRRQMEGDEFRCKCPINHGLPGESLPCERDVLTKIVDGQRVKRYKDDNLCALCFTAQDYVKKRMTPGVKRLLEYSSLNDVPHLLLPKSHVLYGDILSGLHNFIDSEEPWDASADELKKVVDTPLPKERYASEIYRNVVDEENWVTEK